MSSALRVVSIVTLALLTGCGLGQTNADVPSAMIGTVVDALGAVIGNAKVTLYRNVEKEPFAVTQTDAKGEFRFLVGTDRLFKVVAEARCFKPRTVKRILRKGDGSMKLPPIKLQVQFSCLSDEVPTELGVHHFILKFVVGGGPDWSGQKCKEHRRHVSQAPIHRSYAPFRCLSYVKRRMPSGK